MGGLKAPSKASIRNRESESCDGPRAQRKEGHGNSHQTMQEKQLYYWRLRHSGPSVAPHPSNYTGSVSRCPGTGAVRSPPPSWGDHDSPDNGRHVGRHVTRERSGRFPHPRSTTRYVIHHRHTKSRAAGLPAEKVIGVSLEGQSTEPEEAWPGALDDWGKPRLPPNPFVLTIWSQPMSPLLRPVTLAPRPTWRSRWAAQLDIRPRRLFFGGWRSKKCKAVPIRNKPQQATWPFVKPIHQCIPLFFVQVNENQPNQHHPVPRCGR